MRRPWAPAAGLALAAVLLALAGCSATDTAPASPDPVAESDETSENAQSDVPEECATAFPQAFAAPDLSDVEALPADWPDPPPGSTLCLTSSGLGDAATESLSYVTDAEAAAVLTHYEQALAGYATERTPSPTGGEMLTGDGSGIGFQVQPGAGTVVVVIQPVG